MKSFSKLKILISLGTLLFSSVQNAEAIPSQPKNYVAPGFVGIRPAAMGEAFTAVADDYNALYYNPAGLATLKGWSLEFLNLGVGANAQMLKNINDILDKKTNLNSKKPNEFIDALDNHFGKNNSFRFFLNPTFVTKNFGVGLMANEEINLSLHGVNPSLLDIESTADVDFRIGGALSFLDDKLSLGTTLFMRNRYFVGEQLEYTDADAFIKDRKNAKKNLENLMSSGTGYGADFGLLFTPITLWKPTLGLSILNVGDVKFRHGPGTTTGGTPDPLPQSVNVGFSISPQFGSVTVRTSVDFREINLPTPAYQKLAAGVETGWRNIVRVQAGMKELSWTAGFELRLFVLNIRYATYATQKGYFEREGLERQHLLGFKIIL